MLSDFTLERRRTMPPPPLAPGLWSTRGRGRARRGRQAREGPRTGAARGAAEGPRRPPRAGSKAQQGGAGWEVQVRL